MTGMPAAYVLAISVGTWIIGLGFGVMLGVKLPRRLFAWRGGVGFVALGSFFVGVILVLFMTVARQVR